MARALPLKTLSERRDGVGLVLPDPHQLGARLDTSSGWGMHDRSGPYALRHLSQIFARGRLEPTRHVRLDAPRDRKNENLSTQSFGRRRAVMLLPDGP